MMNRMSRAFILSIMFILSKQQNAAGHLVGIDDDRNY